MVEEASEGFFHRFVVKVQVGFLNRFFNFAQRSLIPRLNGDQTSFRVYSLRPFEELALEFRNNQQDFVEQVKKKRVLCEVLQVITVNEVTMLLFI
jgi:hypothetical protein